MQVECRQFGAPAPPCSRGWNLRECSSGTTTSSGPGAPSVHVSSRGSNRVRRRGWAYRGPGSGSGHCRALCGNGTRAPHRDGTRASGTLQSDCSDRPNPGITCQLLVVWIHCCVNMWPGIHLHRVNFHTPCRISGQKSTCHTGEPLLKTIWSTQSSSPHPQWVPSSLELLQPPDKALRDAGAPRPPNKSQGSPNCRLQGVGAGCSGQPALPTPFSALGQLQDTALCSVA